ncbi:hypothetical protein V7S43_001321 [Phytophthora oleae]|uniref:Glycosyl hydrolase family 30 beta sandwich domain-containing protein n=1 Tax=Phytophthora oleae TaxID=2107226 RepID=A0ABD3G392_9STRA
MDRHCQPETLRDAHYSRHIRAGMTILKFDDPNTLLPGSSEYALDIYPNFVVAYDKTSKVLVIVATNLGEAETITFDLSTLASADGPINTWTTEPNATAGAVYKTSSLDNFSAKVPGFQQTFQLNRS